MTAAILPAELAGRTLDCDLGAFTPRLSFVGGTDLRLQATIGDIVIDEVVDVDVTTVRPKLFILKWTESSGNFIVQVQDHDNAVVHNYARLADGQLFCVKGAIKAVVPA